jgi:hypothetical protein
MSKVDMHRDPEEAAQSGSVWVPQNTIATQLGRLARGISRVGAEVLQVLVEEVEYWSNRIALVDAASCLDLPRILQQLGVSGRPEPITFDMVGKAVRNNGIIVPKGVQGFAVFNSFGELGFDLRIASNMRLQDSPSDEGGNPWRIISLDPATNRTEIDPPTAIEALAVVLYRFQRGKLPQEGVITASDGEVSYNLKTGVISVEPVQNREIVMTRSEQPSSTNSLAAE